VPTANIGGGVPPPRQWWAFYIPAALFGAAAFAFDHFNAEYGATDASRWGEYVLFGFSGAWLLGAIRYTVRHFQHRSLP
jgi:hypothetical protein